MKKRVNKKRIIGKIQLIIGILLLIGGITGVIFIINQTQELKSVNEDFLYEGFRESNNTGMNNETKRIYWENLALFFKNGEREIILFSQNLLLSFSLVIIISFLFITQGLINLSKENL